MAVRPLHLEGMRALGKQIIRAGGLLDEEGRMKADTSGYKDSMTKQTGKE